jgi:hypothetical protein
MPALMGIGIVSAIGTCTGLRNYTTITVGLAGGRRCDMGTFARAGAFAAVESA